MRTSTTLAGVVFLATALAGCGGSNDSSTADTSNATGGCPLEITDAWVKAADSGMTAAFGQVANDTETAVLITAAQTTAAGSTELHQTVDQGGTMKMAEVSEFEVPAFGSLVLEPGGDHIMLMALPAPIIAGDDVNITLVCGDDGEVTFEAQARTFGGANEEYDDDMADMPGM